MAEGKVALSKNEQFKLRVIEDFRAGRITRSKAATLLNVTERTITRMASRIREKGAAGIKHGNTGRPPQNKLNTEFKDNIKSLVKERYFDFNMSHCREMLAEHENVGISYMSLSRICHEADIVKHKKRRRSSRQRVRRERMANEGLLWQMDGSHDPWNGKDKWCLIGIIDDATSEIVGARFFESEDTVNCMQVMEEAIFLKGIPESLYVDKAGWFGGTKRQNFSQFDRACDELDIKVLYANSPEAKGRIERAWKTFQDRLKPEMRLHGISTMLDANRYLNTVFLPLYWNVRLTVEATYPTTRYRPLKEWHDLPQIFCIKHKRWVRRDKTINYQNGNYKIETEFQKSISGRQVEIRVYRDGSWSAFLGKTPLTLKYLPPPKRRWTKPVRRA